MNDYAQQLERKRQRLSQLLAPFQAPALEVYESAPLNCRLRAEFRIWHEGEDCCYAMFEPGQKASSKSLIRIEQLPIASRAINELMPPLLDALKSKELTRKRLYQIEFLSTLSGDMLVTLIYHKKLDDDWRTAAAQLQEQLGIAIIGRSRKQKCVLSRDYVLEQFTVAQRHYEYQQLEGGFTQPNGAMCEIMLNWASDCAKTMQARGDLLELYCGNGNFTLPLSRHFRRVLATEVAKTSVYAAEWNIQRNACDNITVIRLSSEELTQALNGEREFRRLQQKAIELDQYDFDAVFVDPPRSGMDVNTCQLTARFEHILYISCNPETLARDLALLCETHRIERAALFDQFPQTDHIEAGVWLKRQGA
ncbi:tRNA (uracil-5-)-methyltransferase [gamma proteobacterium HTCC5015]|nr:tRNA (uracil-5-)-methyltransferase [gamma proteobacterium HTCC5015]